MNDPTLEIGAHLLDVITDEARKAMPAECCGLLVGKIDLADQRWHVQDVVRSENLLAQLRTDRFEIDPGMLLRTQRQARERGQDIAGLYHSHPHGRAYPSETDRRAAWQPGYAWLILAAAPEWREAAAFLNDGTAEQARFRAMRLVVS